LERSLDAVGDEAEGGAALHDLRLTGVMREHEHGHVERGVVSPPAVNSWVVFPVTFTAAEHLSAHHDGPGGATRFFDDVGSAFFSPPSRPCLSRRLAA